MVEPQQPDHDPAIQAFIRWTNHPRNGRSGLGGHDNEKHCPYIPASKLKEYLNIPGRVEALLEALFSSLDKPPPPPDFVRQHCLRPFAILLLIGQGLMIRHFWDQPSLHDRCLPFRSRPAAFPSSTNSDIWASFERLQWQFCSTNFEYNMGYRLDKDEIVPIVYKEELARGGSAIVYKIGVDEEYNRLIPSTDKPAATKAPSFLKTYRGREAEHYYNAERDAFMHLKWNRKDPPHIIGFYGSFIRDDTYNIILEYADRGTLEDFMSQTPPPKRGEDINMFWDKLFDISHGLCTIHGTPESNVSRCQILRGWHQDIKPSNILVMSGCGTTPYDCRFKLADLGLSHFKRNVSPYQDLLDGDRDTFGTYSYGAPETYRPDKPIESCHLWVKQNVDVWSMGCVYSEIATWVVHGWNRVLEYRRLRQKEARTILGQEAGNLFHDGENVLRIVVQNHESICYTISSRQANGQLKDYITPKLLGNLVMDMLQKADERPAARPLYLKSKRLVKEAREKIGMPLDRPQSQHEIAHFGLDYPGEPPIALMIPPSLPPGRPLSESSPSGRSFSGPGNTQSIEPSPLENTTPKRSSTSQNVLPVVDPPANTPVLGTGKAPDPILNGTPSPISRFSLIDPPKHSNIHGKQDLPMSPVTPTQNRRTKPEMSIEEGHRIKKEKKSGMKTRWPGEENLADLNGRDHVFLIDNARSMKQHLPQIRQAVGLLGYMLKDSDPDGIDMYFSKSTQKVNSKGKTKNLLKVLDKASFSGESDMRTRISVTLEAYKAKSGGRPGASNSFFNSTNTRTPLRPVNIYVLTDGIWQPRCEVAPVIQSLVESIQRHGLAYNQVGIQFIRFGDDEEGKQRLTHLDCELSLELDIVDTTHCTFNVWKMLLGAINDWYDDDPT